MPDRSSLVLSRRSRRLEQHRARGTRMRMGGLGLGIIFSIAVSIMILFGALYYAGLTRGLPNVAALPALLNPPDGILLHPTRLYDRTGQDLLYTFDSSAEAGGSAAASDLRRYLPDLIDLIWNRKINPGKVFDLTLPLDQVVEGYRAMDERRAIKTLLRP